jgi:hypothetical protein
VRAVKETARVIATKAARMRSPFIMPLTQRELYQSPGRRSYRGFQRRRRASSAIRSNNVGVVAALSFSGLNSRSARVASAADGQDCAARSASRSAMPVGNDSTGYESEACGQHAHADGDQHTNQRTGKRYRPRS